MLVGKVGPQPVPTCSSRPKTLNGRLSVVHSLPATSVAVSLTRHESGSLGRPWT